jgi:hypothetical protein
MTPKLSKELSDAVSDREQVEAIDPATGRVYVIIEQSTFQLANRDRVHAAIQDSLSSMEAGGGIPLADAETQLRQELGFPPRR